MAPEGADLEPELESVFRDERDALFRYALSVLGEPGDAEDAVHDLFLRLSRQPGQVIDQPKAWIFRVLRNLCVDRLRGRKRAAGTVADVDIAHFLHAEGRGADTPETDLMTSELLRQVAAAIERLPSDEAQTLTLAVVEGMSYGEIAYVTAAPLGTVRSRLHRARRLLRAMVGREAPAPGGAGSDVPVPNTASPTRKGAPR